MRVAIVYDSVFGNTEKVAAAMAEALRSAATVELRRVGDANADILSETNLLIVGSPTRAFRPTPALTAWLKALPTGALAGVRVAAFDTRMDVVQAHNAILSFMVRLFGYAAPVIARRLAARGGTPTTDPAWYIVEASEGPLREGELERAAAWALAPVEG